MEQRRKTTEINPNNWHIFPLVWEIFIQRLWYQRHFKLTFLLCFLLLWLPLCPWTSRWGLGVFIIFFHILTPKIRCFIYFVKYYCSLFENWKHSGCENCCWFRLSTILGVHSGWSALTSYRPGRRDSALLCGKIPCLLMLEQEEELSIFPGMQNSHVYLR